jgi:4-hydroxybenzoyl-CoA reductase alpha subunit
MNRVFSVIGKRLPRKDALCKATGEAHYTSDISLPRMLHGKILRSPHPHARILHIDTSRAEGLPGVKGVITWRDISADKKRSFYGVFKPDETPLATDKVRFIGDEIAAVAAVDEACAQEAIGLIDVSYEVLPPVFDPEEALKPGAPELHEESPGNISWRLYQDLGNIEEGFGQADHIQEDRFVTGFQCHAPLEPHAAVAQFDREGKLTVWASTQRPFFVSWDLAEALGLPQSHVRVIKPHIGGAFGGKMETSTVEFSAAYLARKTGRPVKMILTREEEFVAMRRRHASVIHIKTGVKGDGTITARSCRAVFNGGAYNSLGIVAVYLSALFQNLPYRIKNLRYEALRVYTNNTPCGAMRGFGTPQVYFAVETHMDKIAQVLRMDPAELRLKNGLEAGEVTANGMRIMSSGYNESVRIAAKSSDWEKKRRLGGKGSGIGMGCSSFVSGPRLRRLPRHTDAYSFSATLLYAHGDGKVTLVTGAADIGQGSDSILAQIAAEELGISYEHVTVEAGDTNISPLDYGTYGSRVTMMAGNATINAAKDLKGKIVKAVAEELKADPQDLSIGQDFVCSKAFPETRIPFSEAVIICQRSLGGKPVIGEGYFNPEFEGVLDIKSLTEQGLGNYSPAYSFGTHVVEVKVDQETGQVEVGNMIVTHDCGTPINPMAVEGQLQGSVAMGHGYALTEQVRLDKGLMLNPNFLEYAIPTSLDQGSAEIKLVDVDDPMGPFGAKEAGEGPVSPTAPSIINAIHHATGIWITEIPLDPHTLLKSMKKREQKADRDNGEEA